MQGIVNGTWTLEAARQFLRKARGALQGARALNAAQENFIFEAGSLQRGVNSRGERWTQVRERVQRPYSAANWRVLSAAPEDGSEVYVPATGDVFTYDAQEPYAPWRFVRHEQPNQSGRAAPQRAR